VNCVKDAHEHHNLRMHTHRTRHKQKKTARRGVFSNKKHPKHTNAICSSCILIATWSWLRVERRDMKECEPRWLVLESRRKPFGVEQTYPAKKKRAFSKEKTRRKKIPTAKIHSGGIIVAWFWLPRSSSHRERFIPRSLCLRGETLIALTLHPCANLAFGVFLPQRTC
jgi:hypothetical protein